LIVEGEGVWLDFFFKFLLLLRGRGVEVNVFFPPSFNVWKEEGKGVSLGFKTFFSLLSG